jgi:hypothetical protein
MRIYVGTPLIFWEMNEELMGPFAPLNEEI